MSPLVAQWYPPTNAGDVGLIPGLKRSPGEGNDTPLEILGNPMNRGAWWATHPWSHKESDMTYRLKNSMFCTVCAASHELENDGYALSSTKAVFDSDANFTWSLTPSHQRPFLEEVSWAACVVCWTVSFLRSKSTWREETSTEGISGLGKKKKGTLSKIPEVRLLSEVLEHLRVTWRQAGHHSCPSNPPRAGGQMRASTRAVAAPPHPWAPGVADPEPGLQGALVCTMSLW